MSAEAPVAGSVPALEENRTSHSELYINMPNWTLFASPSWRCLRGGQNYFNLEQALVSILISIGKYLLLCEIFPDVK